MNANEYGSVGFAITNRQRLAGGGALVTLRMLLALLCLAFCGAIGTIVFEVLADFIF